MNDHTQIYEKAFETLKKTDLFENIEENILKEMINQCNSKIWNKGQTIDYKIANEELSIILKGRLKITQIDPESGRSFAYNILTTGDLYDICTLLDGKEHVVFPVTVDDVKILQIPLGKAREWLKKYPEFNKNLLPYLGKKIRELENFGSSLIFDDTAKRLTKLILKHASKKQHEDDEYFPVKLIHDLSHESLAELIGSVRSVISAQIHKLKEEEIIYSKRGYIAIKNLEELLKKCEIFDYENKIEAGINEQKKI